ncbi:hypothetical protein AB0H34_22245 [Saccharopolyspora shandongensis]|uniref:hypothetical protein n=1 Tax=Saccharopolyspora shandongensis TaxID=418495 RepID=UPI0033E9A2F5
MIKESEAELVAAADTFQPGVGGDVGFVDRVGAEVGQFGGLEVAPDLFYRIEVGA